jgi:hypothetical protein
MIPPADRTFKPFEQVVKILLLTAIANPILPIDEFGIERYLDDSSPVHRMAVAGTTGIDTGFTVE